MSAKKKTATKEKSNKMSTAAFIRAQIKAGVEDKKILAAARRRAPKQRISDYYVNWYRWAMKNRPAARRHA